MYSINLLITTFNRPAMLSNLLEQIVQQNPPNTVIHIHNDGSTMNYFDVVNKYKSKLDIKYFYHDHNGKRKYWSLINKVFKARAKSKYYIMLPDDDILNSDFFNKVINKWETIEHPKKACMMPSINQERKWVSCFSRTLPRKQGEVYNSGYVDMRFIAERYFFIALGKLEAPKSDRWERDNNLGSGVGSQISNRLMKKGLQMFISIEDLTYQVPHKSEMNPDQTDTEI